MFGDMLAQMQEKQKALQEKLASTNLTESTDGVSVTVSGAREIVNISVAENILKDGDPEQLEDLLVITLNRALNKAAELEQNESQQLMSGMMPGMPNIGGMFGQ